VTSDWKTDAETRYAAQLTQHGEAVRDSAAHTFAHHQVTDDKNSQITHKETGCSEVEPIARAEVDSRCPRRSVKHKSSSVFPGFSCSRLHLIQLATLLRHSETFTVSIQ